MYAAHQETTAPRLLSHETRTLPYQGAGLGTSSGGARLSPDVGPEAMLMQMQQPALSDAGQGIWQQQALMRQPAPGTAASPWLNEAAGQKLTAELQMHEQRAAASVGHAARQAASATSGRLPHGQQMAAMLNMALSANRAKQAAAAAAVYPCTDDSLPAGDNNKRQACDAPHGTPPALLPPPQPPSPATRSAASFPASSRPWSDAALPALSRNTPSPSRPMPGVATTPASRLEASPPMSHAASTTAPHPASLGIYAVQKADLSMQPALSCQASSHASGTVSVGIAGQQSDLSQSSTGPWAQQGPWSGFGKQAAATMPQGGQGRAASSGMVRIPRSEAWAKFLAYEGCIQICNNHRDEPEAQLFLSDGMKYLRDGFAIGALLLSPVEPTQEEQQHQPSLQHEQAEEQVQESGAGSGPGIRVGSGRGQALWRRGATKAILANTLVKSARAPTVQLQRNDICWDDAEADELQAMALPPAAAPRHNCPAATAPALGSHPGMGAVRSGSQGGALSSPQAAGYMAAVGTGASPSPAELCLKVSVRHAKKHGGNFLGNLVGWVPQPRGSGSQVAMQLRLTCGQQVVSVPLDAKGNVFPGSPSLAVPQVASRDSGSAGGTAPGGDGVTGSGGGADAGLMASPSGPQAAAKELKVELVCPTGPLAGGRMQVHKLWEHLEADAGAEGTPRGHGQGVNGRRNSSNGGGNSAGLPQGVPMEVTLFSLSGDAKKLGTLELAILRVEPGSLLRGAGGSGGGSGQGHGSPMSGADTSRSGSSGGGGGGDGWCAPVPDGYAGFAGVPAGMSHPAHAAQLAAAPAARQPLRMSGCAAMDAMLDAALRGSGCSREQLLVGQPWRWLLQHFAAAYDISDAYVLIAHLRWILRPNVCSLTTHCLTTITKALTPLLQKERDWQLSATEVNLLVQIKRSVQQLLQSAFEHYTNLSDSSGADGQGQTNGAALCFTQLDPVRTSPLQAAFDLHDVLRETFTTGAGPWLQSCFRTAAKLRWQALLARSSTESGIDIAMLLQALSTVDDLHPGDLIRKLQRGTASVQNPQRAAQYPGDKATARRASAVAGDGFGDQQRRVSNLSLMSGISVQQPRSHLQADVLYKGLEALTYAICQEVHYDLLLQSHPGLIPDCLALAQATVEEYCGRFVEQLQMVLKECPPEEHSQQAVNLLVAVAEMQRYLEQQGLLLDERHPGHVSAMGLFRDHVCNWLRASQTALLHICQQLEQQQEPAARSLSPASTFAGLDQMPPPQLFDAACVGNRLSTLVTHMHARCWGEMQGYARVMKHWARFGPDLEAAVCRVLRAVLDAVKRKYPLPPVLPPQQSAGGTGGYRAVANQAEGRGWDPNPAAGAGHRRTQSEVGVTGAAAQGASGAPMAPHAHGGAKQRVPTFYTLATPPASPGGSDGGALAAWQSDSGSHEQLYNVALGQAVPAGPPSMEVLHFEAVLLNSLKYFMVLVPTLEWELEQWCAEGLGLDPSSQGSQAGGLSLAAARSLIGHQFDQFVKELRTEYSAAVTAVACRLFTGLQQQAATNLSLSLAVPQPKEFTGAAGGAEAAEALVQHITGALAALTAGLEAGLSSLRGCVEPRVYVAVGRALWDLCGRELHEFVQGLNEGTVEAAWRARQRAEAGLHLLNDFFVQRLAVGGDDAGMQAQDLQVPRNVDMVLRLLQRSTANANHAYTPF